MYTTPAFLALGNSVTSTLFAGMHSGCHQTRAYIYTTQNVRIVLVQGRATCSHGDVCVVPWTGLVDAGTRPVAKGANLGCDEDLGGSCCRASWSSWHTVVRNFSCNREERGVDSSANMGSWLSGPLWFAFWSQVLHVDGVAAGIPHHPCPRPLLRPCSQGYLVMTFDGQQIVKETVGR